MAIHTLGNLEAKLLLKAQTPSGILETQEDGTSIFAVSPHGVGALPFADNQSLVGRLSGDEKLLSTLGVDIELA